jgi:CubicO group peptidase (beta-lactamase class C family)
MNEVMTHMAGFGYGLSAASAVDREFQRDNPHAQPNLPAAMKRLAQIPLLFQPGERWSYSYTVDVQAAALEKITGKTLGNYLYENVFTPLGMSDTMRWFVGGQQALMPELLSMIACTVNSYNSIPTS